MFELEGDDKLHDPTKDFNTHWAVSPGVKEF
jgi:hypothetical protein